MISFVINVPDFVSSEVNKVYLNVLIKNQIWPIKYPVRQSKYLKEQPNFTYLWSGLVLVFLFFFCKKYKKQNVPYQTTNCQFKHIKQLLYSILGIGISVCRKWWIKIGCQTLYLPKSLTIRIIRSPYCGLVRSLLVFISFV